MIDELYLAGCPLNSDSRLYPLSSLPKAVFEQETGRPGLSTPVGSKLKCPLFVASEMSGFKVVPSPVGLGWFWGWGAGEGGNFPFPCSALY